MDSSCLELLIQTLKMALWLAAPVLLATACCGLFTGTAQAVTSIHDPSIGNTPRLLTGGLVLIFIGPWIVGHLMKFTLALLGDLTRFVH
jgi:flagellar biosynthetic protein FliQ